MNTRATQHDARKGHIQSLLSSDYAYSKQTVLPYATIRKGFFQLINAGTKLQAPSVDVFQQANRKIQCNTTRPDVSSMHPSPRNALVELHELLTFLKEPQEGRESTQVQTTRGNGHNVVKDASDLSKHGANVFGTRRNVNIQQLLDSQ